MAGGYPPGILYECQNKELTKFGFRKLLILKGAFSVGSCRTTGFQGREADFNWDAKTGLSEETRNTS